jgi:hypothetical protein
MWPQVFNSIFDIIDIILVNFSMHDMFPSFEVQIN